MDPEYYGENRNLFQGIYFCYSAESMNKPYLESGDKVIMPQSALGELASVNIKYPMMFQLKKKSAEAGKVTHCGVQEFTAEEGTIYLPCWMMKDLLLKDNEVIEIRNSPLEKGKFVMLQPHKKEFLDLSDTKAVLEKSLRSFICLTTGDTIMIEYNNKKYYMDVLETKPAGAICINETDCEVDFATPLDYEEEPEKLAPPSKSKSQEEDGAKGESKFIPFSGSGRLLNGEHVKPSSPQEPQITEGARATTSTATSDSSARRKQGKLVFGSNTNKSTNPTEAKKIGLNSP